MFIFYFIAISLYVIPLTSGHSPHGSTTPDWVQLDWEDSVHELEKIDETITWDDTFLFEIYVVRDKSKQCINKALKIYYTTGTVNNPNTGVQTNAYHIANKVRLHCNIDKNSLDRVVEKVAGADALQFTLKGGNCKKATYIFHPENRVVQIEYDDCDFVPGVET